MSRLSLRPALRHAAHGGRAPTVAPAGVITLTTEAQELFELTLESLSETTYHITWGDGTEEDAEGYQGGGGIWYFWLSHEYTDLEPHHDVTVAGDMDTITAVHFPGSSVTAIALEKCSSMAYLTASGNQLTALDLSANHMLTEADVSSNPITSLTLSSELVGLVELLQAQNLALDEAAMDALLVSLAAQTSLSDGVLLLWGNAAPGAAGLAAVATLEGRGWQVILEDQDEGGGGGPW